jgi:hypothetical protein
MAIEGLGRVFNVVVTAADTAFNMDGYDAVTFVCNTADTFTVTVGATSAAADSPGAVFDHFYQCTSAAGAAAWTKEAISPASNAVVQAGANVSVLTFHASMMPSGKKWIKCTSGAAGTVVAIFGSPKHQRKPANLPIPTT